MIKLISNESSIVFLDPKFCNHEHMTEIEFHKNSHNFVASKLFIIIKTYLTSIKSKKNPNRSKISKTWATVRF